MLVGVSGRCPDWRVQGESHPLLMEDFVLSHDSSLRSGAGRTLGRAHNYGSMACSYSGLYDEQAHLPQSPLIIFHIAVKFVTIGTVDTLIR